MSKGLKVAILGASRGLGKALLGHLRDLGIPALGAARSPGVDVQIDFARPGAVETTFDWITTEAISHVFYLAAGGPFGAFTDKAFKDHFWATQVTYLFPAELTHRLVQRSPKRLEQMVWVGSSVAESQPDPLAASYAAAKHALFGLHRSWVAEGLDLDLRLFSPGYMDTPLLPPNAWPRQQGLPIDDPTPVAEALWQWSQDKTHHQQHCSFKL